MSGEHKLRRVKIGVGISVGILLLSAYVIFSANHSNIRAFADLRHSMIVITHIEKISSQINEIESAQRGFIIMRDTAYLSQYRRNRLLVQSELRNLKQLVEENPIQLDNAKELGVLVEKRIQLLQKTLTHLHRRRTDLTMGRLAMMSVMMKIDVMRDTERRLIEKRIRTSQQASDYSTAAIIAALVMVTLLILFGSFMLIREFMLKLRSEKVLRSYQVMLKEKIEKLNGSNRELEQFAYIASHDLQEPLRKIITFSERITHKFTSEVSDEMRGYLDRISNAADRMRHLIDDLLMFSRMSNTLEKTEVNLEEIFTLIKDTFEVSIQHGNVRIVQHNTLPTLQADRTQMMQLFQNLLSNAIKFMADNSEPLVEVSCSLLPGSELPAIFNGPKHAQYYRIIVKDNGIGFNQEDSERIFVIFQRLHGRSQYEGTGIGLSLCKKIVENHEGFITVTSTKGQGAAFSVYLPATKI